LKSWTIPEFKLLQGSSCQQFAQNFRVCKILAVTLDKKGVDFHNFLIREIELKFLDFTGIFKLSK
jgi:hypothetical protein